MTIRLEGNGALAMIPRDPRSRLQVERRDTRVVSLDHMPVPSLRKSGS